MSVNKDVGEETIDDLGANLGEKNDDNASENVTKSSENKPTKTNQGKKRRQTLLKRKETGIIRFTNAKKTS